ncbi:hypothetical protein LTR10_019852 [Elasticomyces elasticus]|uniref:Methyltransferase domain-containing protein n=1 Tax=Exophiala sideris TaxID=1016849 RepID=A0ABR0J1B1_9EURO|nr:hypothetical protein LTR10_019852 [Elasticomyces elasticus]KAK5024436.1 hypothetical protein LTS07_008727 [Exophiala sideris]KAK5054169.1 hypothetical protein LTR69_009131 [Exophiala sideris]
MDLLSYAEWQRFENYHRELAIIGIGFTVLVTILGCLVYQLGGQLTMDKLTSHPYVRFAYACMIKPHDAKYDDGQQSALESFYAAQANVYDATRKRLLRGREDMLAILAAKLQARMVVNNETKKPVWYDIGGGTGYNIEAMDKLVGIEGFFEHVFLVDLSTSLCEVARERVRAHGWKNVTILCQDARTIACTPSSADLITMSYSLSMIPDFYSVVDMISGYLAPHGIIGICDFYVQSVVDISTRNYIGGSFNRHVNWVGRMFWRTWFDADRVNLDGGRRDYVEYRFGTVLSASERNYLLGGIPYYIFIGCRRDSDLLAENGHEVLEKLDAALTESPYLSPMEYRKQQAIEVQENVPRSKSYESAIVNLSSNLPLPAAFYQQHHWRIYYNDLLQKHQQFANEYIYAFNWEDPKVDRQLLQINHDDVILTITSAGDNILDYLLEKPKRIHAVDLNPSQNHLLELKVAAFSALPYSDVWQLFGEGQHPDFRNLLLQKLSPHLSSQAFQYWLNKASIFSSPGGLYESGGSRHAIKLVRRLAKLFGLSAKVRTMCKVETLNEQRELWPCIRNVMLSWPLHKAVVSTEWWAWKAAGVPPAQHALILNDYRERMKSPKMSKKLCGEAIWQYVVDTLDPVVETTQLSCDNYFYYLCLQGKYSRKCHPRYLDVKAHSTLSKPDTFDGLRIHTDEFMEVVARISPSTLTIAILMDSMDWFNPKETAALEQIVALNKVLKVGGRVLFRSAATRPWYTSIFEQNGFESKCVGRRDSGKCIDRVNMYASTWICTKKVNISNSPVISLKKVGTAASLEELQI